MKTVATNKKAFFDYQILESLEAGVVLTGPEIKAIRAQRVVITGSYIKAMLGQTQKMELWWVGSHFNLEHDDQTRTKKLLIHSQELHRLAGKMTAKGYAIVPLELYLKKGRAKLKIGLAVRKNKHDKREVLKKRASQRDIEQVVTGRDQANDKRRV